MKKETTVKFTCDCGGMEYSNIEKRWIYTKGPDSAEGRIAVIDHTCPDCHEVLPKDNPIAEESDVVIMSFGQTPQGVTYVSPEKLQ